MTQHRSQNVMEISVLRRGRKQLVGGRGVMALSMIAAD
jgi:hypothetical protein